MSDRLLWFDPGFGASGDMLLGVLLGLGAPLDGVLADLDLLGLDGWSISVTTTTRSGLSATRALVTTDHHDHDHDHHDHGHGGPGDDRRDHHRAWSRIDALLAGAGLPATVADGARRTFALLARVEAGIHRIPVDEVHFHEVGALDAIIDIVGTWSALRLLAVDRVSAGPVGLGNGTVRAAHGLLPAPAPATVELLTGVPVRPVPTDTETVTPTGAALLATMVERWGSIPAGRLDGSARSAGGRDPATHPNICGALLLSADDSATDGTPAPAVVLATNLDDLTPEVLGHVVDRLLDAGADDAWVVPVVMKKGRPGHELRALTTPERAAALRDLIFRETGSLGIRTEPVTRHRLERTAATVSVRGREIRLKVGPHRTKPEHDDLVAAAAATGVPIRQLADEVLRAGRDVSSLESDFCHNNKPQLDE